jgi:hypothetical protein
VKIKIKDAGSLKNKPLNEHRRQKQEETCQNHLNHYMKLTFEKNK